MRNLIVKLSVLVVFVFAVLAGCGGGANAMVGTWKMVVDDSVTSKAGDGAKPEMTMEFKADGTWEGKMKIAGTEETAGGTYTLKEKHLVMKQTTENGKPKAGKDEEVDLEADMKSFALPGTEGKGKLIKQ